MELQAKTTVRASVGKEGRDGGIAKGITIQETTWYKLLEFEVESEH